MGQQIVQKPKEDSLILQTDILIARKKTGPQYKFGVIVPRDISEVLALDKENKNDLWKEAIKMEMTKIIEFEVFRNTPDGKSSTGYQ